MLALQELCFSLPICELTSGFGPVANSPLPGDCAAEADGSLLDRDHPLVFALKRFLVERVSFLFRCEQKPELTPVFANTSLLSVRR